MKPKPSENPNTTYLLNVPEFDDKTEGRLSDRESGAGMMQRYVLAVLLDHQEAGEIPTSGRFVFYELEQRGLVRKPKKGESRRGKWDDPCEQEVTDALMQLRDKGVIPWRWITDETRTVHSWTHAPTVAEYLVDRVDEARVNPWHPDAPPMILCESRSLAGVLRPLSAKYVCPIAATNGQAGGFLRTEVGPNLLSHVVETTDDGKDLWEVRSVLYLGDWDRQGHQIEANTRHVLEQVIGIDLTWERIAITEDQIEERGFLSQVKSDGRLADDHEEKISEAWEAETLGQSVIVELVTDALDRLLPEDPIDAVLERETQERDFWRDRLDGLEE